MDRPQRRRIAQRAKPHAPDRIRRPTRVAKAATARSASPRPHRVDERAELARGLAEVAVAEDEDGLGLVGDSAREGDRDLGIAL